MWRLEFDNELYWWICLVKQIKIDDLIGDRMDGFIEKLVNIVFGDYYTLKNNKWYYNVDDVELCLTMDEMQDYLLDIIENHIV